MSEKLIHESAIHAVALAMARSVHIGPGRPPHRDVDLFRERARLHVAAGYAMADYKPTAADVAAQKVADDAAAKRDAEAKKVLADAHAETAKAKADMDAAAKPVTTTPVFTAPSTAKADWTPTPSDHAAPAPFAPATMPPPIVVKPVGA